ncbi:MAG TPA: FG-GAP repeat protein, partial [Longimicrobiales bacterium]
MRKLLQTSLAVAALLGVALPVQAQNYGRGVAVSEGAVFVSEPGNVVRSGIVYVYRADDGGRWVEAAKLTAPDARPADGFGTAIAVHGGTLLASRPGEAEARGAVHVFEREDGEWRHTARLTVPDAAAGDSLGAAVALDGESALVTAIHRNGGAGAVHVFRRGDDGDWEHEAVLAGRDVQPGDAFGAALAIAGDLALVGAPLQADERGAAYLFRRTESGEWVEEAKLVARTAAEGALLGASVALLDGRAVVGAPRRDQATGAVYVFAPDEDGEWQDATRLLPFAAGSRAQFGVAMAVVGGELWVSAPGADGFAGTVYRFAHEGEGGDWTVVRVLDRGAMPGRAFLGVALGASGRVAAASAPGDDHGAGTVAVYAMDESGAWTFRNKVWSEPESFPAVTGGQVDCRE